jgi:hypothetical protein
VYCGSYQTNGIGITASINVKRWNPAISNPVANLSEYDLTVEGHISDDWTGFSVEGYVQQHQNIRIKIEGRRLEAPV